VGVTVEARRRRAIGFDGARGGPERRLVRRQFDNCAGVSEPRAPRNIGGDREHTWPGAWSLSAHHFILPGKCLENLVWRPAIGYSLCYRAPDSQLRDICHTSTLNLLVSRLRIAVRAWDTRGCYRPNLVRGTIWCLPFESLTIQSPRRGFAAMLTKAAQRTS